MMMLVSMLPPMTLSGSMVLLKPESLLMSMFSVTSKGYADIHGLCCRMKPSWWQLVVLLPGFILMWMSCSVSRDHSDALGLCHQEWWRCPRTVKQQKTVCIHALHMLKSMSQCRHLRPCRCLWSVLSPETMYKSVIQVPDDCKVQGNYFCQSIDDYRITVEKEDQRRLLWQSYLQFS